jgi:hypothetical protein
MKKLKIKIIKIVENTFSVLRIHIFNRIGPFWPDGHLENLICIPPDLNSYHCHRCQIISKLSAQKKTENFKNGYLPYTV